MIGDSANRTPSLAEGFLMVISKRVIIFANGELKKPNRIRSLLLPDDYMVAADGGYQHMKRLNLMPDLLVGDLDSISQDDLKVLNRSGVEIISHTPEKNETDLELALDTVYRRGYRRIKIVAALGGRLDQILGNLFLITRPAYAACDLRIDDGIEEVYLIHDHAKVDGLIGDTVSLIPIGGAAHGVVLDGFKYSLVDETLFPDQTRGISNVLEKNNATVYLRVGQLLCIHTRFSETNG
jgi:thiamine pyrophosphokinase